VAALAEDAAQGSGHGEDELPVRDLVADGVCDPVAGGAHPPLVAGGTEVAGLAGEGEEALVTAIRALQAGEAVGEVATAVELLDHRDGIASQGAVDLAVAGFVLGEEVAPSVMDDLPEGRSPRTAGTVDGRHGERSYEHLRAGARLFVKHRMRKLSRLHEIRKPLTGKEKGGTFSPASTGAGDGRFRDEVRLPRLVRVPAVNDGDVSRINDGFIAL